MATAAEMIECMERQGKAPIPSSIAYYAIQRTKSGRRSYDAGRTDVLSPGFAMDHEAPSSLDEDSSGYDDGRPMTLHDIIASESEDPAETVLRQLDWCEFMDGLAPRKRRIVEELMAGAGTGDIARLLSVSPPRIVQLKREIAGDIREFMGADILAEIGKETTWRRDMRCLREKKEWKFMKLDDDMEHAHIAQAMFG